MITSINSRLRSPASAAFALVWICLARVVADTGFITLVNVTPTGFGVVWRGPVGGTPGIQVFADSGGKTNLAAELGVEPFPLRTGSLFLAGTPAQRRNLATLRQATAARGLMEVKVSGCDPSTTYYFAVTSTDTNGTTVVSPSLAAVTTPDENSFIPAAEQLLLNLTGTNNLGSIVTLTQPNAAYALAAVVGDAAGTNQVVFNLSDLFNLVGGGNFAPVGSQDFAANITENPGNQLSHFSVSFSADFGVANTVSSGLATEIISLIVGSAVIRAGDIGLLPITFVSKVGLVGAVLNLELPPGKLTNFNLQALSPEVDPATTALTSVGGTNAQIQVFTKSGQSLTGSGQILSLGFTAVSNQPSAFVPSDLVNAGATRADGLATARLDPQSGRVVVVGDRPLLEPLLLPGNSRELVLYGHNQTTYSVQSNTNLANTNGWKSFAQVSVTNGLSQTIGGFSVNFLHEFFRALGP